MTDAPTPVIIPYAEFLAFRDRRLGLAPALTGPDEQTIDAEAPSEGVAPDIVADHDV